ncbi:MAG: hypothetical protein EOM21_13130 [Gammaproteobacteria bacterium]|nr:hypothetical protein [Gammaproteobacteria bacterium]
MSIETELQNLVAAVDRLTAAVTGHARTRLEIFDRAGQEALAAIPITTAEELAAAEASEAPPAIEEVRAVAAELIRAGRLEVLRGLLMNDFGVGSVDQLLAEQCRRFLDLAAARLADSPAKDEPPAAVASMTFPAAANEPPDEPPPAEVSLEEALAVARRLIEAGRGALVREVLTQRLGVPSVDRLNAEQRAAFVRHAQSEAA